MSVFGQSLFGGSPFIRWALSPFVLLFAVLMPLLVEVWTPGRVALMGGMEVACLALLAGFWLPPRWGRWAFRVVAALVFLAYAAYVVYEFFFSGARFTVSHRHSQPSPFSALLGFVFIGLPSLMYTVLGRFSLRAEPSAEELEAERRAYEERLLRPDWAFYERHLGRPAPAALRALYADRDLVTARGLVYSEDCVINSFEALDEQGLIEAQGMLDPREQAEGEVVAIAVTDEGDPVYLAPGAARDDRVYMTHHDGSDGEVLAESVATMVERLKAKARG